MIRAALLAAYLVLAATAMATAARAQTCTAAASLLAFGAYDPTAAAAAESIGSVTLVCSGPAMTVISYRLALAGGALRHLGGAGRSAAYQLYVDAAHSRVWGDCTGGTACITGTIVLGRNAVRRSYPIFSRMPPRQPVAPGPLQDVVPLLLSY